jgi:hypothetical protein
MFISNAIVSMYAKDTKIYNAVKNTSQKVQLQGDLDRLVDWEVAAAF